MTRAASKGYRRRVDEAMKSFGDESWLLDAGCEELPDLRPKKA